MGPSAKPQVALVSGSSRGLGLETCRQLATKHGMHVVVTARKLDDARAAAASLGVPETRTHALALDVTDEASIAATADAVRRDLGTLDVLINNAGIALDGFNAEIARRTIDTNVYGVMHVTDALSPLVVEHGRIVMVSSAMGELSNASPMLRERFIAAATATDRGALLELVESFVRQVAARTHAKNAWPTSAYRVSKLALNALTRIVARELASRSMHVNAVCPGWVRTDMGGSGASRSVEEGARSIVWGALLGPDGPSGGFFRDGKAIDW